MLFDTKFVQVKIPRANCRLINTSWAAEKEVVEVPPMLKALKNQVAAAKSRLDPIFAPGGLDKTKRVRFFSKIVDPFAGFTPEGLNAQCVSNSWFKYYELYNQGNLATRWKQPRVFFNAELPGGSLSAWNHYAKTNGVDYSWHASSLAPGTSEGNGGQALDDRHGLAALNPDNWLMGGLKGDGDATKLSNITRWVETLGAGSIDLYSHDAGKDASQDYNDQERINSDLHLGCALTGLEVLAPGGVFIAKQYTCFEPFTLSLIVVLSALFDEFYIVKPITSRAKNSEMYLVGFDYIGANNSDAKNVCAKLRAKLGSLDFSRSLLGSEAMEREAPTVAAIMDFSRRIYENQISVLDEFVNLWNKVGSNWSLLNSYNTSFAAKITTKIRNLWIKTNKVAKLNDRDKLLTIAK